MKLKLAIVDVFTDAHFRGNPVAVIMEADALNAAQMQAIAAWTNLSETVFHLRPTSEEADYRLRIFTPRSELPFAGHPTLGAAHALLEARLITGRDGTVVQECTAGLVPISRSDTGKHLSLRLPPAKIAALSDSQALSFAEIYGIVARRDETPAGTEPPLSPFTPALINVGPSWIIAEVKDVPSLLAITPDMVRAAEFEAAIGATGTTLFARYSEEPEAAIEVRSFAPSDGIAEDPVCGSGNGAVAAYRLWRAQIGDDASYTAHQGRCLGREGKVHIRIKAGDIYVGGACVTTASGTIG